MERDPYDTSQGGSDIGRDHERDLGDEPPASYRDAAPDYLAPIDASSPVSGHVPPPEPTGSPADTPEHDWSLARDLIYPSLRPVGTSGEPVATLDLDGLAAPPKGHGQPLVDDGPAGMPVVYSLDAGAFDVIVNADHLRSWGIGPSELQDAAMRNLAVWSASAPWTDEISGERRLVSSDTGDGWDASRILLPEVIEHLTNELGPHGRILVGVPERHLLVAGALRPNDDEFATLFADFVVETSGGSDEPVDRRVFELVGGSLVEFAGVAAG
ncbi:MAG TPA: DUF1444 family protein [Clostridia bacterium]|nr:DUF1444 family protein [Clostridia bacterium]